MNERILVVDDNPANLKLACDLLVCEGYEMLRAESAERALEILEGSVPDLILMDLSMPGMDGLTLTRKLKADARTRDIVVVALTASAMKGDEERVMAAGFDGYVAKPIDTRAFPGQVAAYLKITVDGMKTILIVDDQVTNRKLLRAILEAEAFEVVEAGDGIEALEILQQRVADTVISDILMPRMDGYQLCNEVRRNERLRSMPFIIYSSTYTSPEDQRLAEELGADRYLTRPAPASVILEAVRQGARRNLLPVPRIDDQHELGVMKKYSHRLVAKLEERAVELAQLSAELKTANGKLRHLLANSPAVIYGLNVEGDNVVPHVVSDNITLLLGFDVDETLRYEWWVGQLHPEDRQRAIESISQTLSQSASRTEYRIRHKDGSYRWIEDNRRLIRDASNEAKEIVGVWADITERKNSEEALQQSEARFSQLAENIPEVFWMTNVDMSEVLYVSPAYESIWGRSIEELYRHPHDWIDAILPEDRPRVIECFAQLGHGVSEVSVEYRLRRPDGSIHWILDRGFPVRDGGGRIYRTAGIATDVTERKRLEENLRRAQNLEAIGQLAGGIAHDFNNILACIVGYAEMATLESSRNEAAQASLREVLKGSQRAKELILQILTFSSQKEHGRRPVRLQPVVEEALKLLRGSLPSTIHIKAEIGEDAPVAMAEPAQIQTVIMNLATNAAHAMDGKGELTVRLARLDIDAEFARAHGDLSPGPHVVLSVSDSGCGMDRQTLQHVFEPFFTTKAPGEGTGLGLAMVHGIMKSHEGSISVYSEPGQGTTFHLYFPAPKGAVEEAAARAGATPRGRGERVLFVDDEPALAALGRKILEHAGYEVSAHTSAQEALEAFGAQPEQFDLVITDLTMPNMSGADLAREMLKLRPDIPIIMATGFGGAMTKERVLALGIRELLMKPATARSLAESVHRALAGAKGA